MFVCFLLVSLLLYLKKCFNKGIITVVVVVVVVVVVKAAFGSCKSILEK